MNAAYLSKLSCGSYIGELKRSGRVHSKMVDIRQGDIDAAIQLSGIRRPILVAFNLWVVGSTF